MDTLPEDIHDLILPLACADGGFTGRSLSSVSRYIRNISAPFKWYSLSISGPRQAQRFAHALKALEHTRRPLIRHLFLSTRCSCGLQEWNLRPLIVHSWSDCQSTILQYAAPTLRTLTFLSFDPLPHGAELVFDLLSTPFPRLTELSIRTRCLPIHILCVPRTSVVPRQIEDISASKRPCLRHLHLACTEYFLSDVGTKPLHDLIHACSPDITHLRLSIQDWLGNVEVAKIIFAECVDLGFLGPVLELHRELITLEDFQENSTYESTLNAEPVSWARLIPSSVQLFVIQPPEWWSTHDGDITRIFSAMERAANGHFVFAPWASYGYWDALADWLDRIEEGPGCWVDQGNGKSRLPEDRREHLFCSSLEPEQSTEGKRLKVKFRCLGRLKSILKRLILC